MSIEDKTGEAPRDRAQLIMILQAYHYWLMQTLVILETVIGMLPKAMVPRNTKIREEYTYLTTTVLERLKDLEHKVNIIINDEGKWADNNNEGKY
jgi:hypothetical protein